MINTQTDESDHLLADDEPAAYRIERENGLSPFFLICDHASALIPKQLSSLGLSTIELKRHIAWDIGAAGVASKLAALLDAFVIFQNYSRLVIDCNRPIGSAGSIVRVSERTPIPGNERLTTKQAAIRARDVFNPYHHRICAELDMRRNKGRPTVLVSIHSFTPTFLDQSRCWHAGILYNRDQRLARPMLEYLRQDVGLVIGDNEPYSVSDVTDYAIPEYGERRGILHVEIEIRQDLIADESGQKDWAQRLTSALIYAHELYAHEQVGIVERQNKRLPTD